MELETDVCIVGAGPGGAMLAVLLAEKGIPVILVERHASVFKEFRGEHLNEDGERILHKHGVLDEVQRQGMLLMKRIEYMEHGHLVRTVVPEEGHAHVGIHVPQKHLLQALFSRLEQNPNATLLTGVAVNRLLQNDRGVIQGVGGKRGEEEIFIRSRIVVGADGRYSTVRKLAGIETDVISHGYDLLWARIPAPEGWEPVIRMALAGGAQLAMFTQQGGFIQIGWSIPEGAFPAMTKQPIDPLLDTLVRAYPDIEHSARANLRSWRDFVLLKVHSSRAESWVKDGLVIMGDAAHTMSPTGAFGLNCALNDADTLARVLLHALEAGDTSAERLTAFERSNRVSTEALQKRQLEMERSFAGQFSK
ncbi:FAD-dependent monooxygenase [Paenibacillus xylaniclasticus]|uniref:FAD-dependent monooxygenase n=1 Tax=Paenibacillus xylaniclasticus TaxID=588083 RepID=UPI000FDCA056|nr:MULTISPECIES: FAD-dependent monooxygenase [Paenibacillus]GFN31248.1 FAD-dependent oxidoreductase [Paenibacillus curdlanolyticus]